MKKKTYFRAAVILLASVFLAGVTAEVAEARERQRSGSYVTGKGKTGTYNNTVSGNRRKGVARTQSITTQSGRTLNRTAVGTYNRQTGGYQKTVTGADGVTRTYTGTARGGQSSGTYTTSRGKAGSYTTNTTRNGDGTATTQKTWTGENGKTHNSSATTGYDKETGVITRSVTGPGGKTYRGSVAVTPDQR